MADHSFDSNAEIRAGEDGGVAMIANKQVRGPWGGGCLRAEPGEVQAAWGAAGGGGKASLG